MVRIYPFRAVRPLAEHAQAIAAVPYDVVNASEAWRCIQQNPLSFLRVTRADAEIPSVPPYDDRVYAKAREAYLSLLRAGFMVREGDEGMYIYRVLSEKKEYLGLVACIDTRDYLSNAIRRHEFTVYEKEEDRTRHIQALDAQEGMVFLVYRNRPHLSEAIANLAAEADPMSEVETRSGTRHQVLRIGDRESIESVREAFGGVEALYIADGHHRAAAAVNVALKMEQQGRKGEEWNRFMGALFAHDHLAIHGYHRLVTDLGRLSVRDFLRRLEREFTLSRIERPEASTLEAPRAPDISSHQLFMYLAKKWYMLEREIGQSPNPVDRLDVTVLQRLVLEGMLGIEDPRKDPRLHYLSGSRGHAELSSLVDSGKYIAGFALQPVSIETVMAISDAGGIMPPKSTWFEPKLLSGLLVHPLD